MVLTSTRPAIERASGLADARRELWKQLSVRDAPKPLLRDKCLFTSYLVAWLEQETDVTRIIAASTADKREIESIGTPELGTNRFDKRAWKWRTDRRPADPL